MAELRDYDKLEEFGCELLSQNPPFLGAIELLTFRLQQAERLEATARIATKAAQLFPDNWQLHFQAGVGLKGIGKEKEACKYLRQALAISPNDRQTISHLMKALTLSDGIESAALEYKKIYCLLGKQADMMLASISTVPNWVQKSGALLQKA